MSFADINLGPHPGEYAYLNSIFNVSAIVILYYDYMLTLPREIRFLWPPHNKQGWFTLTCFLNRYLPLFGHLPLVMTYFVPGEVSVCQKIHAFHENFNIILQVLIGTLCLIRVYALYGRSIRVLCFLLGAGFGSTINGSLMMAASSRLTGSGETNIVVSGVRGCNQGMSTVEGLYGALSWMGVLLYDIVIFSLTLYKAFTIGRGGCLFDVMVRDGTMYFSVLSIMNLGNILMFRFAPPSLKNSTSTSTNVLSTTLVSRLVLNVREQNSALAGVPTTVETEQRFQAALPAVGPITSHQETGSIQV
ncbi:hypothetical protein BGW80DRAFT_375384 [Lactifluus volemus]|nr:hypothetical protein BGW80DRAFT_375384 [Lactifluus volemus]